MVHEPKLERETLPQFHIQARRAMAIATIKWTNGRKQGGPPTQAMSTSTPLVLDTKTTRLSLLNLTLQRQTPTCATLQREAPN